MPIVNAENLLIQHYTENNEVVTIVISTEDGENVVSRFPIGDTSNPQKVGSAITYAKRYNLGQLFNIITDEDDDGNKASVKSEPGEFDKKNFTPTMLRSFVDNLKK